MSNSSKMPPQSYANHINRNPLRFDIHTPLKEISCLGMLWLAQHTPKSCDFGDPQAFVQEMSCPSQSFVCQVITPIILSLSGTTFPVLVNVRPRPKKSKKMAKFGNKKSSLGDIREYKSSPSQSRWKWAIPKPTHGHALRSKSRPGQDEVQSK